MQLFSVLICFTQVTWQEANPQPNQVHTLVDKPQRLLMATKTHNGVVAHAPILRANKVLGGELISANNTQLAKCRSLTEEIVVGHVCQTLMLELEILIGNQRLTDGKIISFETFVFVLCG